MNWTFQVYYAWKICCWIWILKLFHFREICLLLNFTHVHITFLKSNRFKNEKILEIYSMKYMQNEQNEAILCTRITLLNRRKRIGERNLRGSFISDCPSSCISSFKTIQRTQISRIDLQMNQQCELVQWLHLYYSAEDRCMMWKNPLLHI